MARRLGAKEPWILAVRHEEPEPGAGGTGSLDDMDSGWIVALRYAELVTESGHRVTDALHAQLGAHWTDGEIVEIISVIGLFAYFNRFNDALRVPVTK